MSGYFAKAKYHFRVNGVMVVSILVLILIFEYFWSF